MATKDKAIGRAKTVLVFGTGSDEVAVVSSAVAHVADDSSEQSLSFKGPVIFDDAVVQHITEVVLPVVNHIFELLKVPQRKFEISVVNLSAASAEDNISRISGFSADVPILLAMLSAGLGIPVPEEIVSTGHIASTDGDIGLVKSIPTKLEAAQEDRTISRFIYPCIRDDSSLKILSPKMREEVAGAIARAKRNIRTAAIRNVADLIKAVFFDEAVVFGSLRQGFFEKDRLSDIGSDRFSEVVRFLSEGNDKRFWSGLERYLLRGENDKVGELLVARARFHIDLQTYPGNFGRRLLALLYSLPPATLTLKVDFPLMPIGECIRLCQYASESDHDDVIDLFNAASGKGVIRSADIKADKDSPLEIREDHWTETLENVLSEISEDNLARKIALPIDTARASYTMDSVTVRSKKEFFDTIVAFYLHIKRHTREVIEPADKKAGRGKAVNLVDRAFSDMGGRKAAMAFGKDGINGGMRFVLDRMTDQYKFEELNDHVNGVVEVTLDSLDEDDQVAFMGAFLNKIGNHLPPDIRSEPPHRYAKDHKPIVREYVKSMDRVKRLFRAL